jgi:hypothetical protein
MRLQEGSLMHLPRAATLTLVAGLAWVGTVQGQTEKKREPALGTLTDAQLRQGTSARAGRSYAWMGYNTPEIHLQLPASDNSAYAETTFAPARLLDKAGRSVPHEVEQGLYDAETHRNEVRFTPSDGKRDAPPVDFAHAVGTIKVRYPAAARTVAVKPGLPVALHGAKVSVTASSVVVEAQPGWKMLEPPFGSDLDVALRVFDASGKRLEEDSSQQMSETLNAGGQRTTHAFKGKIAQARLDVVEEWAEMDLSYDLPPSPLLATDAAGTKPAGGDEGGPTVHPSAVRREAKGSPPAR